MMNLILAGKISYWLVAWPTFILDCKLKLKSLHVISTLLVKEAFFEVSIRKKRKKRFSL